MDTLHLNSRGDAGPYTLAALGLAKSARLPNAILQFSVEKVRAMFPHTPLTNIEKHLPRVLAALAARPAHAADGPRHHPCQNRPIKIAIPYG